MRLTIPGRYSYPPIHFSACVNHEILLAVGTETAYFNALDLVEAVMTTALLTADVAAGDVMEVCAQAMAQHVLEIANGGAS